MKKPADKQVIGRVEKVSFPELGIGTIYARIDTGAQTSSVWVSYAKEAGDSLEVIFFGKGHPEYTGEKVIFKDFSLGIVSSSNGQAEERYKVKILITIGGKRIRARLTLADRSTQVYPVLVGRNVLRGKFLVDVKAGDPLIIAERIHSQKLQARQKGQAK